MPEDLDISEGEEVEEVEVEFTTRQDYIAASYNAINAVVDMDTGLMTKEDERRKKRIIRKSLRIIDECVNELYDELFEEDEED